MYIPISLFVLCVCNFRFSGYILLKSRSKTVTSHGDSFYSPYKQSERAKASVL
jgi:hypothetical protein